MPALNWILFDDAVVVACDTLVADARDGAPLGFRSKVLHLGHARSLIAGIGLDDMSMDRLLRAAAAGPARDVMGVAAAVDRGLAAQRPARSEVPGAGVYLFGWDAGQVKMRGFGYRAEAGFAREPLRYGFGINPPFKINLAEIDSIDTFFSGVIVGQRAAEESERPAARPGIGGEVLIYKLTDDELESKTLFCFADCNATHAAAMDHPAHRAGA